LHHFTKPAPNAVLIRRRARFLTIVGALLLTWLPILTLAPAVGAQEATPGQATPAIPAGVAPQELTSEQLTELEAYIADLLAATAVPGAAVAVVQNGEVVYQEGFGVRALGDNHPVTPDTLMLVGSTQKSMTSMLAATLVDAGDLQWDSRLVDLLSGFATADPELTRRLTVADAFCACSGLPRRDLELVFNGDDLSAEELVASLAKIAPVAPFGEAFQYSNQMYAAGGYAVAVAAGESEGGLHDAYVAALTEHVLEPIGMATSTFSFTAAEATGDYAVPHAKDLSGAYEELSMTQEAAFVHAVAPAGGLWSSAREMAAYLQTVLADGLAPDGTRVVSAENLERTWQQRVATAPEDFPSPTLASAYAGYGLGWVVGNYAGQPMLSHSGTTLGFTSQIAIWPEADLGIVVLMNGAGAGLPAQAVQFRLAELLFAQPAEIEAMVTQSLSGTEQQQAAAAAQLGERVDAEAVTPFLGRYANAALGELSLVLEEGRLVLDWGEFRAELRPLVDEQDGVTSYVVIDPPIASLPVVFRRGADGAPELVIPPVFGEEYVFEMTG
jgi:CubicO group peptidase (beta-lactamase class C family)